MRLLVEILTFFLHFSNFSVPPRIKPKPEDGNIVVKKGTEVNLECTASGNPVPTITWDKQVLMNSNFLRIAVISKNIFQKLVLLLLLFLVTQEKKSRSSFICISE